MKKDSEPNLELYKYLFRKSFISLRDVIKIIIDNQKEIRILESRSRFLDVGALYQHLIAVEVEKSIDCVIFFQALMEILVNDYLDFFRLNKNGSFKKKGESVISHVTSATDFDSFHKYLVGYRKLRNDVVHSHSIKFDYKVYNVYDVYHHLKHGYEVYRVVLSSITNSYCSTWEENLEIMQIPSIETPIRFESYNLTSLSSKAFEDELARLRQSGI